jgi:MscS family membrane protein
LHTGRFWDAGAANVHWVIVGEDQVEALRQPMFDIPLWQYAASLIYIFLAFYVSRLLDWLVRGQLRKWARRTQTRFDDLLLEILRGPIKIVAFVIFLHLGLRIFIWPEWFADFLRIGLKIIVAVSVTYMALKFIDLVMGYWQQRANTEESVSKQLLPLIRNTLKVFVAVIAVLLTLQNLGLNITSLIASLSIGGLAISLAASDTLSNLFGAVAVLADKPFRVGDRIKIDQVEGVVESIGLRSTRVRGAEGNLISIPNKVINNATVTRFGNQPSK